MSVWVGPVVWWGGAVLQHVTARARDETAHERPVCGARGRRS